MVLNKKGFQVGKKCNFTYSVTYDKIKTIAMTQFFDNNNFPP